MKIMTCPVNGPRNVAEFAFVGEVRDMPDPAACGDAEWADFVFHEANAAGVALEWWVHAPTNTFFVARRHTVTDVILETMTAAEWKRRRHGPGGG